MDYDTDINNLADIAPLLTMISFTNLKTNMQKLKVTLPLILQTLPTD